MESKAIMEGGAPGLNASPKMLSPSLPLPDVHALIHKHAHHLHCWNTRSYCLHTSPTQHSKSSSNLITMPATARRTDTNHFLPSTLIILHCPTANTRAELLGISSFRLHINPASRKAALAGLHSAKLAAIKTSA